MVATMNRTGEKVDTYLEGIYNTVIVRDIEDRQARLEQDKKLRKITDISLLKSIAKYLASTIGSIPSTKAREVIRIGRKRNLAAYMADCTKSSPLSTCTFANSTIKIAFLAASPTNITKPIWK